MRHRVVLAILLLLSSSPRLDAQTLGAYTVDGRSGNIELQRTRGYGGSLVFPATEWLGLRIGIDTREGSSTREGITCRTAAGRLGCGTIEPIEAETRMDGLTIALMPSWQPIRQFRISAGAGPTVVQMRHDPVSASGRDPLIVNRGTAHAGVAFVAELVVQPIPIIPLAGVATWQHRTVFLEGCNDRDDYQPFCGRHTFRGVQLGGAIVFE